MNIDWTKSLILVIQLSKDVQITLFGFSQGVATQLRWIHARQPHFHRLICWAGSIPEDIEYDGLAKYFAEKDLFLAYGDQDEFLTEFRIDQLKDLIKTKGLEVSYFEFEGKHEIPELAIKRCWDWVNKVQ